jgi:hypothetical protein
MAKLLKTHGMTRQGIGTPRREEIIVGLNPAADNSLSQKMWIILPPMEAKCKGDVRLKPGK